jgi:hypothetical protein
MHGHFDGQLNFSAVDFSQAWGKGRQAYLANSAGQVRVLTNQHLQNALSGLPIDTRALGVFGLQKVYVTEGLPGDTL